ncbi:MAG: bifunctional precorrin-2 dehydrogenase/sirohydrochlorin ferrochelatase [Thermodesulfobacteriaceae bacterium]|nr:bifunctional precorrin-2 dehydrogenase/sirohydrochlorin ferrochelatase [Thermodesulfobacteriaceae bacterium]MCX8041311.1 bifunctional precorrin-2 dehydrogenase/sirohydrochlorin ferrochelatase [Thermodesulfobacteriaceae bacterium]
MIEIFYPIFLNLKGKLCVVIGGGQVAERKIEKLLSSQAVVKVIAPQITSQIENWYKDQRILWEKREYQSGDLEGAWLAIAATNNPEVQKKVAQEAEERKIFCNVIDQPSLGSFIVPSVIKRGDLILAISTSSASPAVSKRLREELEQILGPEYKIYTELMKNLREQILKNEKLSPYEKALKLQRLVMAPLVRYIKYKDFKLLEAILQKENLRIPWEIFDSYFPNIISRENEKQE